MYDNNRGSSSERISSNRSEARRLALKILWRVDQEGAYADILLDRVISQHSRELLNTGLMTELVYGILRWQARLDFYLAQVSEHELDKMQPEVLLILRMGAYQLLQMDNIPPPVAVNESVNLGDQTTRGLINAVLRRLVRCEDLKQPEDLPDPIERIAAAKSHPKWLVERWVERWGQDDCLALCTINNQRTRATLRANTTRTGRDGLLRYLKRQKVDALATEFSPWGLRLESYMPLHKIPGYNKGLFTVQDEASQAVVLLLGSKPGERILDACAAPGTKSLAIAQQAEGQARIFAIDKHARRLALLREEAQRLGIGGVRPIEGDSREPLVLPTSAGPAEFDRVLVDAPCSGLGTLSHHPDKKWSIGLEDITKLAQIQKDILNNVAGYLKPGGVLVYSTCTYPVEENEQVIEQLIESGHFELEDAALHLPPETAPLVQDKVLRSLPHKHSTDGFTAFRLKKTE